MKSLSWCFVSQRLSRPFVETPSDRIELGLRVPGEVDSLGQVLPQEAIRILVRSALPRAAGITEIHLDVGAAPGRPSITPFARRQSNATWAAKTPILA
jgi:hypothetical protein